MSISIINDAVNAIFNKMLCCVTVILSVLYPVVPHPQKQLSYNTSKAGVVKLTQTLGTEWIDRGVRVNCISP